jgi:hypothetical protein
MFECFFQRCLNIIVLASKVAAIATIWGIVPLISNHNVVGGLGNLSKDNRLVITQEWIAEGILLFFLWILVEVVTVIGKVSSPVVFTEYALTAAML